MIQIPFIRTGHAHATTARVSAGSVALVVSWQCHLQTKNSSRDVTQCDEM